MTEADYNNLSAFSCGDNELDNFFQHEVKECVKRHYLSAYCAVLHSGEIIAAFTLMNDALMLLGETEKDDFINDLCFEIEEDAIEFFNRQTSYPAINIGHLGTCIKYQSNGVGTAIIDLIADTFRNLKQSGCQFMTVDALRNDRTLKFYRSCGFSFQTNKDFYSSTRRMYRILQS